MWTFCCQAPIAGEMCRSCRCTSDCGYFLPLLTSVAEKPTNDFFKMKDTTFPFSHLQQLFSFDKNLCLKWRRSNIISGVISNSFLAALAAFIPWLSSSSVSATWEFGHNLYFRLIDTLEMWDPLYIWSEWCLDKIRKDKKLKIWKVEK